MTSWTANPWTTVSAGLAAWWRNVRAARAGLAELNECGQEVPRIARDLGLAPSELRTIAAKRPDAADQLKLRLEALHLDAASIRRVDPLVMRDLERVCTQCGSQKRCVRDFVRFPDDTAWREYCPNAMTFEALDDRATRETPGDNVETPRTAS